MKYFYINRNNKPDFSSEKIRQGNIEATEIEVTPEEVQKILDQKWIKKFDEKGKLVFEQAPEAKKHPQEIKREELKEKLTNGEFKQEDIIEALKIIL